MIHVLIIFLYTFGTVMIVPQLGWLGLMCCISVQTSDQLINQSRHFSEGIVNRKIKLCA